MKFSSERFALWREARLRRATALSAACVAAAAAGAVAALLWSHRARQAAAADEARVAAMRVQMAQWQAGADSIEGAIARYRALVKQGFVGRADAVALSDWLQAAAAARALPPPAFELTAKADEALEGGTLRRFDLSVQWVGLHEEEWLAMLHGLQQAGLGAFDAQHCTLRREAERPGLAVHCLIRWTVFEPKVDA